MSIDELIDILCNPRYALACLIALLAASWVHNASSTVSVSYLALTAWCCSVLLITSHRLIRRSRINWEEEVVVVTGSSGGLGKAIVSALHAKGCRLVCVDIVQDKNSATYKDDDRILHMTADVTDAKQVKEIPYKIQAKFDGRDATIVISNAGVMVGRKVLDFEEGQFERTISINLLATYYLVRAFLPGMLSSGRGHIVATSSIIGYIGVSQLTDYSASKHALVGFIESLRFELDKKYKAPAIRTTLLVLGKLSTPLFARTTISPLSEFLTPTQDPNCVAKALIDHLERAKGGKIYLPYLARLAPVLKGMPERIRDAVQRLSGADEALQVEREGSS